jgi:hypothetical protein
MDPWFRTTGLECRLYLIPKMDYFNEAIANAYHSQSLLDLEICETGNKNVINSIVA